MLMILYWKKREHAILFSLKIKNLEGEDEIDSLPPATLSDKQTSEDQRSSKSKY